MRELALPSLILIATIEYIVNNCVIPDSQKRVYTPHFIVVAYSTLVLSHKKASSNLFQ